MTRQGTHSFLNKTGETHVRNKSLRQTDYKSQTAKGENSQSPPHGRRTKNNPNFIQKPPLPNIVSIRNDEKPPKTDYLKERRMKRETNVDNVQREVWLKSLNNKKLSKKEKFLRIKEKAREIEELALRKEQLLNVKSTNGDHHGGTVSGS